MPISLISPLGVTMLKATNTLQKENKNEKAKDGLRMIILEDDLAKLIRKA